MKNVLVIYTDGGSRGNPGSGASAFVVVKNGIVIFKDSKFLGDTTNNIAEYEGVLSAMKWLVKNFQKVNPERIIFFLDSQLVANQLNGKYKIKNAKMVEYALAVRGLEKIITSKITFNHIPRKKNILADQLVNDELNKKSFT